jgi:radical SAM superfamily enzyme YgiQ (UPF0313 family)
VKVKLIYPKWPKMKNQPGFHLPPHGPVCFAAALDDEIKISFTDEHVQELDFNEDADLIMISCMLTCQMPRGWEIADQFRAMGKTVIMGGIGANLHSEESQLHVDSVFLGEAEGYIKKVLNDFKQGKLKKVYDFRYAFPDMNLIGPARRSILNRNLYNYRGVQMVDLVHASRGCRFNCFPCCTPFLGGRQFRPRPIDRVVQELETIDNNRLFFVDNSFAQDIEWTKDLFRAIAPLKKKWVSHPIGRNDELLDLAAAAGSWYVYQAVVDTSDHIREVIKSLKDRGIGVEATVILGTDDHDEDSIKRLIDFLMNIELDLAEFTVMTPFPHSPIREKLIAENRILHNDWIRYTGAETVFKPARMSVDDLDRLFQYAWDTFYGSGGKELKMGNLYMSVIKREIADGTYHPIERRRKRWLSEHDKGENRQTK